MTFCLVTFYCDLFSYQICNFLSCDFLSVNRLVNPFLFTYLLPVMSLACRAATKDRHSFLSLTIFLNSSLGLFPLHHFSLDCSSPCISLSPSFSFPFWCPVKGHSCDGILVLSYDMADPFPSSS